MEDVLYDSHTWIGAIVALFIFSLITFAVLLVAWWWDHRKARRQEIVEEPVPRRALLEYGDTVEQEPVR